MSYIGNPLPASFQSLPAVQRFNGNASTTAFTLAAAIANDQSILVSVDGVVQDSNAYSVSGTTLTVTAAPSSGTGNIFVNTISPVGSTLVPTDGSVTTAKVLNDDVTEVKRGKRIQRKKKYFPGYVLIKSEMDNNIYHMIKNIKRVSGFLGTKGMPVPVSDKEIEKILGQIKDGVAQPKSGIEYSVGEKVQVVDGPFASFSGMVEDIDEEKSRLKVSVSIFGRPTPVDLEYNQVEKVS